MCTHRYYVRNRYTGKNVLVSCGRCPACRERKAMNRTTRIKNTYDGKNIALFVTLTYKNQFIPYIKRDDLRFDGDCAFIPVYRDMSARRVRITGDYEIRTKITYEPKIIDELYLERQTDDVIDSLYHLRHGAHDKISVPYFKDLQDFQKRLSINLKRRGYTDKFQYYQCNELGPTTHRSHFHLLIFIRPSDEEKFRDAILQAWPYADNYRTKHNIQVARNAASYVAKYVNCDNSLPSFYRQNSFRQKHSYSQNFGMGLGTFSFSSIQALADQGDLSYFVHRNVDGKPTTANIPIPTYVINRYFPQFKGYSRIDGDSVRNLVSRIIRFGLEREQSTNINICRVLPHRHVTIHKSAGFMPLISFPLDYSVSDYREIAVKLKNAYKRCRDIGYDGTVEDYAFLYERAWRAYKATVFRLSFDDVVVPEDNFEHYDNLCYYVPNDLIPKSQLVRSLSIDQLCHQYPNYLIQTNYNMLPRVLRATNRLEDIYYKSYKKRKVMNFSMAEVGHDV